MATDELKEHVRSRYAAAARRVSDSGCGCRGSDSCGCGAAAETEPKALKVVESCCGGDETERFGPGLYDAAQRGDLPIGAVEASLGCGNPLAVAELREGETVLDLGSGGGIDVLLSAKRVGPTGRAYGLDMTDEMLELARRNAAQAGATNVEFVKGEIEDIPLPDASVDVVISNCVINLSGDKPAVFAEVFRTLRPGGRFGVSDVVAEDQLSAEQRAERGEWVGCIAGALSISEYRDGLAAAGFGDIDVSPTHQVAEGMHSAIVRATKPVG
ncbi:MAG TPA: arsenite methyltransferase [Stackebrandtia sp.]|jgi:SAM-dependent methyltransferase|uniref:arsenite methyltransferase n=1 Tax=Stackebrandtia sp. TaxID=2023065 RepID=UPI002D684F57|nr:arsenite methyltransferase [Stackebrandtia sp.]HZE39160.1 arsenite methyltransferase [Stackebrandtia sp.]